MGTVNIRVCIYMTCFAKIPDTVKIERGIQILKLDEVISSDWNGVTLKILCIFPKNFTWATSKFRIKGLEMTFRRQQIQ